ncbi:MAG: hypothetical protein H7Y42_18200 [Chitinophagaceae bacterium]|nr:hypothetical protein [Chitinophagaceae bacterium]
MGLIKKYSDKLYLKQWGLGFLRGSIADIIRNKTTDLSFDWMTLEDQGISHADPFIFRTDDGRLNILFESVSTYHLDGKISLMVCNDRLDPVLQKVILDTNDHLSYPFVYKENGRIYVFPENAFGGSLNCYEFDQVQRSFINKKEIINLPIIDPTILKFEGKYWLFATMLGDTLNSDLHIFYSDSLLGPYQPHAGNPVKQALDGSRPAGNFIIVDGEIYRPTQNCGNYYGESITINRVTTLTTSEFNEEAHMVIEPNRNDEFNYGIHTINVVDDIIIVDGQKGHFQPVQQLGRKLKTIFT